MANFCHNLKAGGRNSSRPFFLFFMLDLFILLITISINLALAVLILIKNRKPVTNKIFIAFIFFVLAWILANYFADHSTTGNQALFWSQISWMTASYALLLILFFSYFFPIKYKNKRNFKLKIIFLSFLTTLFAIFCLTPLFKEFILKAAIIGEKGLEDYVYGPYFIFGTLFFSVLILMILTNFFINYRKVKGFEKNQIKYFIFGLFLFLFFSLAFSLVLPFLTSNSIWSKFSPLFSTILVGATTYAIVRHRLMDIRLFIQKTILYAITFTLFFAVYLSVIYVFDRIFDLIALGPTISSLISAALIIAFYSKFKLYFQKKTDKFFYRYPYDVNQVLKEINKNCNRKIDFDNFFTCFSEIIEEKLKINKILLVVLQKNKKPLLVKNHNFSRKLTNFLKNINCPSGIFEFFSQNKMVAFLEEDNPVLKNIIAQNKEIINNQALFKKSGVNLILPIYRKDQLTAFFFFGPKLSEEDYYPDDLQLLATLIDTLSLSFENIFLYTDLKKTLFGLEERVNRRTKELIELNENQSRFMADISHELQTPLAVIKGNLSLINQQNVDLTENHQVLSRMERSVDRLSHLIKDLIFLSKADSGKIEVNKEDFNLSDLVQKSYEDSLILAEYKNINLQAEIEKDILLFGDKNMIQSLLFNLISNALKYTDADKEIKIKLFKDFNNVYLIVKDQGVGIDKNDLPYVFSRFYRIEHANNEKGTGLGLAICNWIVQVHNGKIKVQSELNQGTSFKIILPLQSVLSENKKNRQLLNYV